VGHSGEGFADAVVDGRYACAFVGVGFVAWFGFDVFGGAVWEEGEDVGEAGSFLAGADASVECLVGVSGVDFEEGLVPFVDGAVGWLGAAVGVGDAEEEPVGF
jgi:hypothetical protein